MADTTTSALKRNIASLNPEDFIAGGGLPKRIRGPVQICRYVPRSLSKDSAKHGFFAIVRITDEDTDKTHDVYYRAGWLPGQYGGTVPTNDGPEVDDAEREPTAPIEFFRGLADGTKSIPADTDIVEEYGGKYAMGDSLQRDDAWWHFLSALSQCGFDFPSQSLESIEGLILTLESTKTGSYKDKKTGEDRDQNTHLPIEMEAPTKKKSSKADASSATKKKAALAAAPPDADDDDTDDDADDATPAQVLEGIIVSLLKKSATKSLSDFDTIVAAQKHPTFMVLSKADRKVALTAYNDRSLFEESEVLLYDEDEDVVKLAKAK